MEQLLENIRNWLKGVDWNLFIFLLMILTAAVVFIIVIITFIVNVYREKQFQKVMKYESSSVRVYRVDAVRDNVLYFDLGNLNKKRECTIEEFYKSFPGHEPIRIKNWFKDILEGKETTNYLQTTVYIEVSNKKVPSFLRVVKQDSEKGVIHLESYLLLDRRNRVYATPRTPLSTERDFADLLRANGTKNGMAFCFTIKGKNAAESDTRPVNLKPNFLLRYRLILETFVKGNSKLIGGGEGEYIVVNFDMNDNVEAINYALKVITSVTATLKNNRHGGDPLFEIKAGVVPNKDLLGDAAAIVLASRKCAANAFDISSNIFFYKQGIENFSDNEIVNYRSEVERIIFEKKIIYTYRPIYCITKQRIVGFIGKVEPSKDCAFENINELKNYAVRAKDDKSLFVSIAKNLVNTYVAERELKSQKLFYPVLVSEIESIPPYFSRMRNAQEANIVFNFRENDVMQSIGTVGVETLVNNFKAIKEAGFGIAFTVEGHGFNLDKQILALANYFVVDFSNQDEGSNIDTVIRSQLHSLVEKLLKYKRPIIASNLKNWNAIELVVGSGLDYVTSDIFAPFSQELQGVNKKNETKIKDMQSTFVIGKGK